LQFLQVLCQTQMSCRSRLLSPRRRSRPPGAEGGRRREAGELPAYQRILTTND
jgi:hypothetical protein